MLNKLHKNHSKNKENKPVNKKKPEEAAQPAEPARKKNWLERNRFVDYPKPEDSDDGKKEESKPKQPVAVEDIVSFESKV